MIMEEQSAGQLRRNDYLLLTAFCLLFFGFSLIGGRPLSMHEGVLPQSAREMLADHDWVIPKNGGRPWLESPPLPQWITVGIASLFGHCDQVWIVRIGPALAATWAVLLVAWMAAGWFGRTIGLLSGLILATCYEFAQYAWLAEDEIFLCAIVTSAIALFVRTEFVYADSANPANSHHFFGRRPWRLLAFFAVLGMTNLAKGLLFGTVMTLVPIAGFLILSRDLRRISYYCWCWGWLAFAAVALAWPAAAYARYPDVVELWLFDHVGRLDGGYQALSEPWWYYLKVLPTELAPWTAVVPLGLWLSRQRAIGERYSPERFLWCWALLTPAVFSIPSGKHHHYLLHCVAPWAVLAAPALVRLHTRILDIPSRLRNPVVSLITLGAAGDLALWVMRGKIHGPSWLLPAAMVIWPLCAAGLAWAVVQPRGRLAATTLFSAIALAFCGGHLYAGRFADQCREDTIFLQQVRKTVPSGQPLLVNTNMGSLDEFRIQFYLDEHAIPLHNLSFLADERIPGGDAFVIARFGDAPQLALFGTAEVVLQSTRTRREKSIADRLTLFHLRYADAAPRLSSKNVRISPMQVMGRAEGPYLYRR